jgi:transposase
MPTKKSNPTFSGQKVFIGIDVHKNSWSVAVRTLGIEVAHFTQTPEPQQLARYLESRYPGGSYMSAYEAGFCGTSHHEHLVKLGIQNMIINAADLPQTDKQRNNKSDLHDSRFIARYLEKGLVSGIHVMPKDQQERRSLFRCREVLVRDCARAINRVRSFLYFFGIDLPSEFKDKQYISKNFLNWLYSIKPGSDEGHEALEFYLNHLVYLRKNILAVTNLLRRSVSTHSMDAYNRLLSVPGIGCITAIGLLSEVGDFKRFNDPDEFTSYLGLIPSEHRSGQTILNIRMQPRCNMHLRPLLIEASWLAIKKCPYLLAYYKEHAPKGAKKAIVKVARKLALIARSIVLKKTIYQPGYNNQNQEI